jgi:hypothetical protein
MLRRVKELLVFSEDGAGHLLESGDHAAVVSVSSSCSGEDWSAEQRRR